MTSWLWSINRLPRSLKRGLFWLLDLAADRVLAPGANGLRRELGLPRVGHITSRWWHAPQRAIGLFPDWFAPPQPDWPAQTALTDFPLFDEGDVGPVSQEIGRYLDAGDPPVVFVAGSGNRQAARFFSAAVEACHRLGCRGDTVDALRRTVSPAATAWGAAFRLRAVEPRPATRRCPRESRRNRDGGTGARQRPATARHADDVRPTGQRQSVGAAGRRSGRVARSVRRSYRGPSGEGAHRPPWRGAPLRERGRSPARNGPAHSDLRADRGGWRTVREFSRRGVRPGLVG